MVTLRYRQPLSTGARRSTFSADGDAAPREFQRRGAGRIRISAVSPSAPRSPGSGRTAKLDKTPVAFSGFKDAVRIAWSGVRMSRWRCMLSNPAPRLAASGTYSRGVQGQQRRVDLGADETAMSDAEPSAVSKFIPCSGGQSRAKGCSPFSSNSSRAATRRRPVSAATALRKSDFEIWILRYANCRNCDVASRRRLAESAQEKIRISAHRRRVAGPRISR